MNFALGLGLANAPFYGVVPALPIIGGSPPAGTVGTPYSWTPSVRGGVTPYSFAITVGALPAGLTLNSSTGAVTGTPTTAATSSFTIKVTDALTHTASLATSITVNSGGGGSSPGTLDLSNPGAVTGLTSIF